MRRFLPCPYSLGVLVGFLMVIMVISGHALRVGEFYFIGTFLYATGLFLWPIFALAVLLLPMLPASDETVRRLWVRSTLMPPIGSVLAVTLFSLIA